MKRALTRAGDAAPAPAFQWPRFRELLLGGGTARARLLGFLDGIAATSSRTTSHEVLSALFGAGPAVERLAALAPRVHHVGLLAPGGISAADAEDALRGSAFHHSVRSFGSEVWAREVQLRLGRPVEVTILQAGRGGGFGIEVFVAALPATEVDVLLAEEAGCHVALGLDPDASFDDARAALRAAGADEPPLMRGGPSTNVAIGARMLYADVRSGARTRRVELITPARPQLD